MKSFIKERIGNYEYTVRDYKYKSKPPVSVLVSGLTLGECTNPLGNPCYFFKAEKMPILWTKEFV